MVHGLMEHPLVSDCDEWYFHTVDAHHEVYAGLGYKLFPASRAGDDEGERGDI